LDIGHVIFVQSLHAFFNNAVSLSIPVLPQQDLAEVDCTVDITKHFMKPLWLMGIIYHNDVLKIWQDLFLNVSGTRLPQRRERFGKQRQIRRSADLRHEKKMTDADNADSLNLRGKVNTPSLVETQRQPTSS
jgi:hypothetical protein